MKNGKTDNTTNPFPSAGDKHWHTVEVADGYSTFDAILDKLYEVPGAERFQVSAADHKALYLSHQDQVRFAGNLEETIEGSVYRFQCWDFLSPFGIVRLRITGRKTLQNKNALWIPNSIS